MKTWFTYIVVSQLTGSPLIGILVQLLRQEEVGANQTIQRRKWGST